MFLNAILFGLASLVSYTLGALPTSGGPYFIQNPQTSFVVDVFQANPNSGTAVIGFPVNSPPTTNQMWTLQQIAVVGTSGIYAFTSSISSSSKAYVNGLPAGGFQLQTVGSPLNITEQRPGIFSISFPFTTTALTTTTAVGNQLLLQPLTPINPLQQWTFTPTGGSSSPGFPTSTGPSSTFFTPTTTVPFHTRFATAPGS